MQSASYLDEIMSLISNVPMVTQQQIIAYMNEKHPAARENYNKHVWDSGIVHILNALSTDKRIWKQPQKIVDGKEYALVAKSQLLTKSAEAKYFPYAFWLYLASDALDAPCVASDPPFLAAFTRHAANGNDLIAQVAVLDCEGKTSALTLAVQTSMYNDRVVRQWLKPQNEDATELPKIFWRALVVVNMPDGFLESKEFRQLQGVGYSRFFAANTYEEIPRLIAKADDTEAWKLTVENSTKDM